MGMYTDFCFDAQINANAPKEIIDLLTQWAIDPDDIKDTPTHPFFDCSRWPCLGYDMSYYFDGPGYFKFEKDGSSYYLNIRGNFKNYDNEIDQFLNWVKPYLDKEIGQFLGFHRYEENTSPTLIFMQP